jgi:Na+/serine symporter
MVRKILKSSTDQKFFEFFSSFVPFESRLQMMVTFIVGFGTVGVFNARFCAEPAESTTYSFLNVTRFLLKYLCFLFHSVNFYVIHWQVLTPLFPLILICLCHRFS